MKIVSLNVNQFLGHHSWTEFRGKQEEHKNESDDYQPKVMQYLKDHIKGKDDIAILHEIPYFGKMEVFRAFCQELEKSRPHYYDKLCFLQFGSTKESSKKCPYIITCAVMQKDSSWKKKDAPIYSCSNDGEGEILYNRAIELYNQKWDMHLLGVHIPATENGCVMWDDIIEYYTKMCGKNLVMIGDFNAYAEGTYRKRRLEYLISLGAVDAWVAKGKSPIHPTFQLQKEKCDKEEKLECSKSGSRLDYALLSPSAFWQLQKIKTNDKTRDSTDAFTDHSAIELTFKTITAQELDDARPRLPASDTTEAGRE